MHRCALRHTHTESVHTYYHLIHMGIFILLQTSDTHKIMIQTLEKADFVTQEFILSPLQFGVPYSRPRYFCLVTSLLFLSHSPLYIDVYIYVFILKYCIMVMQLFVNNYDLNSLLCLWSWNGLGWPNSASRKVIYISLFFLLLIVFAFY